MDGMNGYTQNMGQPDTGTGGYGGNAGQQGAGTNYYMGYGQSGFGVDAWGQPMYRMPTPEEEVKAARKHFSKLGLHLSLPGPLHAPLIHNTLYRRKKESGTDGY